MKIKISFLILFTVLFTVCGIAQTGDSLQKEWKDKYDEVKDFSEGLAVAIIKDKNSKTYGRKFGFVDRSGNEIIPLKYNYAEPFSGGLALVRSNSEWSFIDKTGKEIIPLTKRNLNAESFSGGLALIKSKRKYGFIDKTGKIVISLKKKYGAVESFSEGLASVEYKGKYGFIDTTGKEVIPAKYDDVGYFINGLSKVRMGDEDTGKYGFIDKTGKEVIPLRYDYVYEIKDGLYKVILNEKSFYIDKFGKCKVDCENAPADHPKTQ